MHQLHQDPRMPIAKKQASKSATDLHPIKYELDEIVPITRVEELLKSNLLFDLMKQLEPTTSPTAPQQEWRVNQFALLVEFLQADGVVRRYYSRSREIKDPEDSNGCQRMYTTCGRGLQWSSREIRGYLCQDSHVDVDIKNCFPTILLEMGMKKKRYHCPIFEDYCKNRDKWRKKYPDIKRLVFSRINDEIAKDYKSKYPEVNDLLKEIQDFIETEMVGVKMHDFLSKHENELIGRIYDIFKHNGIDVIALVFDGLIAKKHTSIDKIIARVNTEVAPFEVVKKNWDLPKKPLKIVDTQRFDYQDPIIFKDLLDLSGKHYISRNHFYLQALPLLLRTTRIVGSSLITKSVLSSTHDSYEVNKFINREDFKVTVGTTKAPVFFKDLITLFGRLIRFATITPLKQPSSHTEFSTDCGFLCQHIPLPDDWEARCKKFKKHILEVNANGNDDIAKGFYWYYANAIQTELKSQVIMISTGKEGCGKSITPSMLIEKILGNKGYIVEDFSTVVGKFNSSLAGKRMVLVNEMSNKDSAHRHTDMSVLNNLVDAKVHSIERKGIDKITAPNVLEFIGCSNWRNCISQSDGAARRNFICQASDKYCGDHAYFNDMVAYWEDDANVRSIFEFLMRYDVSDRQFLRKLPMTESKVEGLWRAVPACSKAAMIAFRMKNPHLNPDVVVKVCNRDMCSLMKEAGLTYGDQFSPHKVAEFLKGKYQVTRPQNVITYNFSLKDFKHTPHEMWQCVDDFVSEAELLDKPTTACIL